MASRLRLVLLLLAVPLALFAPIVLSGRLFLPLLPGALEPLASEDPVRAEAAREFANFSQSDRLFPVLTDQLAIRQELLDGSLPTWEPNLGLGYPLAGGSIAAPTYPPNLLGILASPTYAAAPLALLSLFLAGLGTFLFLRRLGLGLGPTLVAVLAVQLGGFPLSNLFYGMKVDAALWLPWSLWAIEGLRARRRGSILALSASVALSFLAGFVTIAVFHLAVAGAWSLTRLLGSRGAPPEAESTAAPRLVLAGLAVLAGLSVSSIGVLPLAAQSGQSIRAERTVQNLADDSLPYSPLAYLGLVVRDFVDAPTSDARPGTQPVAWWITPEPQLAKANEKSNALEWNLFAGAGLVALALIGLLFDRRRAAFPAVLLVGVLGFAQAWPIVQPLFHVPGLNIGSPGRVLSMAWFLWPWLAALGVEALPRGRALPVLVGLAALGAGGFALAANWCTPETWAEHATDAIVAEYGSGHGIDRAAAAARVGGVEQLLLAGERLRGGFAGAAAAFAALVLAALCLRLGEARSTTGARALRAVLGASAVALALAPLAWSTPVPIGPVPLLASLAAGVAALVGLALFPRRLVVEGRWLPLALVIAIEGFLGASGHVTARVAPAGPLFPENSPALDAIRTTAAGGRVLRFDPTGVSAVENLARPNFLQPYGVADLCAWIVFTPRTLVDLAGSIDRHPERDMRFRTGIASLRTLDHVGHPLFDAWNVTCVLSQEPLEHPRLHETFARPGFHVYRRDGALGPARYVTQAVRATSEQVERQLLASRTVDPRVTVVVPAKVEPGPARSAVDLPTPTVTRPSKRRLDVSVDGGPGGWLVVHEQWAPGWQATIEGQDVPIVRADHTLRAVRVPAGPVTVRFVYAPPAIELGLLLGLAGAVGAVFLETRLLRRRVPG